jgi:hypothetical protein
LPIAARERRARWNETANASKTNRPRLWYGEPDAISNAIGYAKFFSRSHDATIRVYDESGNVIETHEHAGDFKEW